MLLIPIGLQCSKALFRRFVAHGDRSLGVIQKKHDKIMLLYFEDNKTKQTKQAKNTKLWMMC
jgi:hypothetical protein